MLYVVHALDQPGAIDLRLANYERHKAHIATAPEAGLSIFLGGPLLLEGSGEMIGSLTVYQAESLEAVESFLRRDPFKTSGVYAEVRVTRFDARIGAPRLAG